MTFVSDTVILAANIREAPAVSYPKSVTSFVNAPLMGFFPKAGQLLLFYPDLDLLLLPRLKKPGPLQNLPVFCILSLPRSEAL